MKCELLAKCNFFKTEELKGIPSAVKNLKNIYCEGNPLLCAHRRVAKLLGPERIPQDLRPDQAHRVQEIIIAGLKED